MKLREIREYLKSRKIVSHKDISTHFDISDSAAQFALNYWQNKGKITTISLGCHSTICDDTSTTPEPQKDSRGCGSCSSAIEQYQWLG